MRVLVLGAGAIGTSIAYLLARRGVEVTVVERSAVACAASGKSGGFLALDWCDGTPLMRLARRSFELHEALAAELDGDWGYRRLETFAGAASAEIRRPGPADMDWLSSAVTLRGQLGSPDTTAQVHPRTFSRGMMTAAEQHGAHLRIGEATDLIRQGERVVGVEVAGERIEADAVVIAMGPWSILAARWLPLPSVFGMKGHSLVFDTGARVPPEALFIDYEEADGTQLNPEVFPRLDGTTYVCAISSQSPLPVDPEDVAPDEGAIERLADLCGRISPVLAGARIVASGACFRPVTQDGLPLIGAVAGAPGAFVATGHSVWGILNAPATGEAMAELICEGRSSLDLRAFDPGRLTPLDPAGLVTRRPLPG